MEMITSRSLTSRTYSEEIARAIVQSIRTAYFGEFVKLAEQPERP